MGAQGIHLAVRGAALADGLPVADNPGAILWYVVALAVYMSLWADLVFAVRRAAPPHRRRILLVRLAALAGVHLLWVPWGLGLLPIPRDWVIQWLMVAFVLTVLLLWLPRAMERRSLDSPPRL